MSDNHRQRIADGQTALQRGAYQEAFNCFKEVYDADNGNLAAAVGVALSVGLSGNTNKAVEILTDLLTNHPPQAMVHEAMGIVLADARQFQQAETHFRKALRQTGFQPSLVSNLGTTLNELGRCDEASAMFRRCLRKNPGDVSARYHLGLKQLLGGDYALGWEGFAFRNQVAGRPAPTAAHDIAVWQGEPLADKRILLHAEQGLGDTIQFARFAKSLASGGATVFIACDPILRDLLMTIDGVDGMFGRDQDLPPQDYQASLLDLPGLLGITAETVPYRDGYISVPESASANAYASAVGGSAGRRVGLVWSGNPNNKTDAKRSIRLAELLPLLDSPGCTFCSLQIGAPLAQLDDIPEALRPINLFAETAPLADVARVLAELDVLITVDTLMAHLAGAMGVPVWTMVSRVPDWRWMLNRDDTPWYGSMRLFRQAEIGDWSGTVESLCAALNGSG
jgi:tetratricopeptide (TPR) repeat protein